MVPECAKQNGQAFHPDTRMKRLPVASLALFVCKCAMGQSILDYHVKFVACTRVLVERLLDFSQIAYTIEPCFHLVAEVIA